MRDYAHKNVFGDLKPARLHAPTYPVHCWPMKDKEHTAITDLLKDAGMIGGIMLTLRSFPACPSQ